MRTPFAAIVPVRRLAAAVATALAAATLVAGGCTDAVAGPGNASPDQSAESRMTTTKTTPRYSPSGHDITPLSEAEIAELAEKLTPEQFRVTQKDGTEPAFCGNLLDNKKDGVYCCVVCGLPLFSSDHKFDSGTGWPSFFQPFDLAHVHEKEDRTFGMVRTEIECARCGAHLGHVFNDGPAPTGMRHCLNSASLVFHEEGEEMPAASRPVETKVAYFAGGCFWGIEHYFQKGPGVLSAESGFMQGHKDDPTYKEVVFTDTGHAETVKVVYDPKRINYERLLEAFFTMHDPTQLNRQGPDVGEQYRSGIYAADEEQLEQAKAYIEKLTQEGRFKRAIVTEVEPAKTFYAAEDYHQDYILKTGRACHVTNPW